MTPGLLIDAIVRQTTVLLAVLATASGQRLQVAHVANRVFLDLAQELREQGLGTKVIADMFGMALRTYQVRVARLRGSNTYQGQTLWSAVLGCIEHEGPVSRGELLDRFRSDDDATVRAVLRDLVDTGLVVQKGRNEQSTYAVESTPRSDAGVADRVDHLVQVAVFREGPVTAERIAALLGVDRVSEVSDSLDRLVAQGRVERLGTNEDRRYRAEQYLIPFESASGWEAAVFDHYQAMVTGLVTKLSAGQRRATPDDTVGGSTFSFDLWKGHPMEAEVLGFLRTVRAQGGELRRRVEEYGAAHRPPDPELAVRVVAYVGQSVRQGRTDDAS